MDNPVAAMMGNMNPVMAAAQGAKTATEQFQAGTDWATKNAQLDINRQQVQNQVQQNKLLQREFDFKMGTQFLRDKNTLSQMDDGPTKDQSIKLRSQVYDKAGFHVDPTQWTSTKDPAFDELHRNTASAEADALGITDATAHEGYVDAVIGRWKNAVNSFTPDEDEKFTATIGKLKAEQLMVEATKNKIGTTQGTNYVNNFNKEAAPVLKELSAQRKLDATLKAAKEDDGGVALQAVPLETVRSMVSRVNETELKAMTGSPDVESYVTRFADKRAAGKLTETDYRAFKKLNDLSTQNTKTQYEEIRDRHSGQMSQNLGVSQAEAVNRVTGGQDPFAAKAEPFSQQEQTAAQKAPQTNTAPSLSADEQSYVSLVNGAKSPEDKQVLINKLSPQKRKKLGF